MINKGNKPVSYSVIVHTGEEWEPGKELIQEYEYLDLKSAQNHIDQLQEDRSLYSPQMMATIEYNYPE